MSINDDVDNSITITRNTNNVEFKLVELTLTLKSAPKTVVKMIQRCLFLVVNFYFTSMEVILCHMTAMGIDTKVGLTNDR